MHKKSTTFEGLKRKRNTGISVLADDCKYRNTQLFSQVMSWKINLKCYDDGLQVEISCVTVIE